MAWPELQREESRLLKGQGGGFDLFFFGFSGVLDGFVWFVSFRAMGIGALLGKMFARGFLP